MTVPASALLHAIRGIALASYPKNGRSGPPYRFDIRVRKRLPPGMPTTLRIKITAKRQATFPAAALKALRVKPGDYLELIQDKDDWRLTPVGVDLSKLGTLRDKIAQKHPPFDLAKWRDTPKDHARLRD